MKYFSKNSDERILSEKNQINKNAFTIYFACLILIIIYKSFSTTLNLYNFYSEILISLFILLYTVTYLCIKKVNFKFLIKNSKDEYINSTKSALYSTGFKIISIISLLNVLIYYFYFNDLKNLLFIILSLIVPSIYILFKYVHTGVFINENYKHKKLINNYKFRFILAGMLFGLFMTIIKFIELREFSLDLLYYFLFTALAWGLIMYFICSLFLKISNSNADKRL